MTGLVVVLVTYVICASEELVSGAGEKRYMFEAGRAVGPPFNLQRNQGPIKCYHCSTYANDHYCADPFNDTHHDVKTIMCYNACAKWVRQKGNGPRNVIRTCSTEINLNMPVNTVCMSESRPGDGHLCFCRRAHCNSGSVLSPHLLLGHTFLSTVLAGLTTLFLAQNYFSGSMNVFAWWTEVVKSVLVSPTTCLILPFLSTLIQFVIWTTDVIRQQRAYHLLRLLFGQTKLRPRPNG